ncbi:MAG: prepilin-type N-terminal cleavage/methylation domain-containing protein [Candidatus Peribacteria bacterium]|jgi:prepilin-type N-terminal cleavage/methylation domain-containing protein|nr:prepilin-type N-terminal cleavage/methylation domain-containing protein [Candidatus Peribacteria bacterium]
MKKHTFKAFTLVEMLIVIVIIGILISALLPRLQGAQSMARDTARKTALSQIGAGITAYQAQYGAWPLKSGATGTDSLIPFLVSK